jgi:hypothetical protein
LALRSHLEPARRLDLGRAAEIAADHALHLGRACGNLGSGDWLRGDLQRCWLEAGDDSAAALALAPANAKSGTTTPITSATVATNASWRWLRQIFVCALTLEIARRKHCGYG